MWPTLASTIGPRLLVKPSSLFTIGVGIQNRFENRVIDAPSTSNSQPTNSGTSEVMIIPEITTEFPSSQTEKGVGMTTFKREGISMMLNWEITISKETKLYSLYGTPFILTNLSVAAQ